MGPTPDNGLAVTQPLLDLNDDFGQGGRPKCQLSAFEYISRMIAIVAVIGCFAL
jgi:hypothetical protein